MTRTRSLKRSIRTRAAKTGERYTTARRHLLQARAATAPLSPATPIQSKGSVTDAKTLEKTGQRLDHWFAVLDRFGGVGKGHTALARHLHDCHGIDGWYAQGITVAYERARGARTLNQRASGDYEVSISKVVAADTPAVVKAFLDGRMRRQWLMAAAKPDLADALETAVADANSKRFVVRPDGQGRFRYTWGQTTVQVHVLPRAGGKVSVVVTNLKLPDMATLDARRSEWRAALASLARVLEA